MRFSLKDNYRINQIIASLSNDDHDVIRTEVQRLTSLKRQNPFFSAVSEYDPSEFTQIADEWLSLSDVDYQVMLSENLWDALTARVTREYAIGIFIGESAREEE